MTRILPLYAIVFLSGGSVLAIEILGTRILGPFYGVSLFLWSALITVTLAALSLGYVLGGRWADRGPSYARLGMVLAVAGLLVIAIPWLKYPVLKLTEPLGLRAAVLITATILFGPALTLMGTVSPYAIRLRATDLSNVGRTAGDVYAVSTLASVVAALLTGFVLIPNIGVGRLIMLIGALLILAAAIAFSVGRRGKPAILALVAAPLFGLLGWTTGEVKPDPDRGLVAVRQSPYAEIRVLDWEQERLLIIDGGGHTVVERDTWKTLYPYAVVMDLTKFHFAEPGRLLLLGLGGGSIAKSFHHAGWDVDVVEIDPVIAEVAAEFFGLQPREATVHVMDAREYLLRTDQLYDLVIVDAFGSSAVPFHLVTQEAFGLLKSRLTERGVVAMNIEQVGWHGQFLSSLTATLREHFETVKALPLAEPPTALGNIVILAGDRDLEEPDDTLTRPRDVIDDDYLHWVAITQMHAWENRFVPEIQGAPVLTDDLNPVDLWSEAINLEARKVLHGSFDWKHLGW